MTREEQLKEAAKQRADQYDHPSKWSDTYYGFIDGAKWADSHPAWVSVKKELPEPNTYKEGKTFPSVLVCLADGYIDTDAYDTDNKVWCKYDGEVEYWMVLPTPPVKKGGQDAS